MLDKKEFFKLVDEQLEELCETNSLLLSRVKNEGLHPRREDIEALKVVNESIHNLASLVNETNHRW
ncbi:MAG: hypothetical protein BHK79_02800 [Halanaerobium sp. MDAL1]|nr:MAG: hypothetical protein BHK79_02800 [Halanaerobium sp. MDAL1]